MFQRVPFLLALALNGCVLRYFSTEERPRQPVLATAGRDEQNRESSEAELPFTLRVLNEYNDGEQLHVRGEVQGHVPFEGQAVALRVAGIAGGEERNLQVYPLSRLLTGVELGATVWQGQFTVAIPSREISNYQLELVWGGDAKSLMGEGMTREPQLTGTSVQTTERQCPQPPCGVAFQVVTQLKNVEDKPLKKVVLALGFVAADSASALDLRPRIPENEELVTLNDLALATGASRALRLVFDKTLTPEQSRKLQPVVRVKSFEFEQ